MWWEREPLVGQLETKLNNLVVTGLLFDADDTLFETTEYMRRHQSVFCVWVADSLGINLDEVKSVFERARIDSYNVKCVSAERWDLMVRLTAEGLTGDKHVLDGGIDLLKKMFFDSPEVIMGIRPILDLLSRTGRKMGIVTHVPNGFPLDNWTWIKLQRSGLAQYFSDVWIADDRKAKDSEAWIAGAKMLGLSPEEILGFGDSVPGDILPMLSVGIRPIAVKSKWRGSNGELPAVVPLMESLTQAPETILALNEV